MKKNLSKLIDPKNWEIEKVELIYGEQWLQKPMTTALKNIAMIIET